MSDEDLIEDGDEEDTGDGDEYVAPAVPSGYIPGLPEDQLPAGQSVEERGAVVPSPEEVNDLQREALKSSQEGGAGSPGSPDTAAAGSEHEDR